MYEGAKLMANSCSKIVVALKITVLIDNAVTDGCKAKSKEVTSQIG
jgi:hypothetical protein